jgi:hypothetical protein
MIALWAGLSILSRVGAIVALLASVWGAWALYLAHERREAADAAREQYVQELVERTRKESNRREAALLEAQDRARTAAAALALTEDRLNETLTEIARASAQNDTHTCLDAAAVDRLQRLTAPDAPRGRRSGRRASDRSRGPAP